MARDNVARKQARQFYRNLGFPPELADKLRDQKSPTLRQQTLRREQTRIQRTRVDRLTPQQNQTATAITRYNQLPDRVKNQPSPRLEIVAPPVRDLDLEDREFTTQDREQQWRDWQRTRSYPSELVDRAEAVNRRFGLDDFDSFGYAVIWDMYVNDEDFDDALDNANHYLVEATTG